MVLETAKQIVGGAAGFGIASAAAVIEPAVPHFGPALVVVLGHELPLLPALIGAIGVIATREFAPIASVEARISARGRHALTAMMVLAMIALVLSGERRPLVIVGIAGGLGYSGVAIFELLAAGVVKLVRLSIDIFTRGSISVLRDRRPNEDE